ncbi:hypothetical protein [Kineococcus aurantiacus]|uniref:Uncharacterized protein involved in exopolysaccharide biosynthesis n=1 Tax=Kineococcus aurantiacus TaxID=37633 RepID=A0A7Y9DPK7_9ACTN|nr:hypothetical protein [Kineococcus aurantiacus]NYD24435.1 uncharacterized protein involved in exopolysaccharide biosynthesis [Kineococcus aurantiacus]
MLAVLGALVGVVVGAVRVPNPQAVARVLLASDPTLPGEQEAAAEPDRFIQTQLLLIASPDVLTAVRDRVGDDTVHDLGATQVGVTDVIEVSASAPTAATARDAVTAALAVYDERRAAELTVRADAISGVLDDQLAALAAASGGTDPAGTEASRLLAERNELALAADSATVGSTVVQAPVVVETSRWGGAARAGVTGLVLGALLGLLFALARARSGGAAREG